MTSLRLGLAASMLAFWGVSSVVIPLSGAQPPRQEVRIEGVVFCVDLQLEAVPCTSEDPVFALRTDAGRVYRFLRKDVKAKIFEDPRVRARRLLVRAWPSGDDALEVIKAYSVRDGQLFDLHYYCSVCSIKAYAGGPCWCCQDKFEFREVPVPSPE